MFLLDKQIDKFNLYERNIYKYMVTHFKKTRLNALIYTKINRIFMKKIYLNYIEVPITTKCSLCCKECANLIQFYANPYHINEEKIINDINKLCNIVDGIETLRILGGEPLLHPKLSYIIRKIINNPKIHNIQVVTNGTILLNDDLLKLFSENKKISLDISYYKEKANNYEKLEQQLRNKKIKYYFNKSLKWTKQSDCRCRHRSKQELKKIFMQCKLDCISLLNGQIHLCPRSSHGTDLKLISKDKKDFLNLRTTSNLKVLKKKLYVLLNTECINACDFCDVYKWRRLEKCIPGEQALKKETITTYNEYVKYNRENTRMKLI